MAEAGKGSRPRPISVSNEEYSRRWDAIFCRDEEQSVIEEVSKLTAEETLQATEKRITGHSGEDQ